jgi:hypothetical protein
LSQQINLFNPIFRIQKKYFSTVTMLQALAVIGLACGLLVAEAAYRMRALETQFNASNALLAETQARRAEAVVKFPARKRDPVLSAQIADATAELAALQGASSTLQSGEFGNANGFSEYFRAFARQSVSGLWLTELTISGASAQIGVKGNTLRADLVPDYMGRLAQEPVMKGKAFSALNIAQVPAAPAGPTGAPATQSYLSFSLQSEGAAVNP